MELKFIKSFKKLVHIHLQMSGLLKNMEKSGKNKKNTICVVNQKGV